MIMAKYVMSYEIFQLLVVEMKRYDFYTSYPSLSVMHSCKTGMKYEMRSLNKYIFVLNISKI